MSIIDRALEFIQEMNVIARRSEWEKRRCLHCGTPGAIKHGTYPRTVTDLSGPQKLRRQRYLCKKCGKTYAEEWAWVKPRHRYSRAVQRKAIDMWVYGRTSLRRVAEFVRSDIGQQERWRMWVGQVAAKIGILCLLHASTVCRWKNKAGVEAKKSIWQQLKGIATSGEMGTDGLWVNLKGKGKGVILALMDSVTGLIFPPVVVDGEEGAASWKQLFDRAEEAGLDLGQVDGVTSDGAQGLLSCLRESFSWVHQQRCVWHLWRNLGPKIRRLVMEDVADKVGEEAEEACAALTRELTGLVHRILDAASYQKGEEALADLAAHRLGKPLADYIRPLLDAILYHSMPCHQGLLRVGPEWIWRDFRQRVSRGRNHGADESWERAALLWAICWNFTPAQKRSELKRIYRRSGKSPLEMAGTPPGDVTYLDALRV